MSLNQARQNYATFGASDVRHSDRVRSPRPEEYPPNEPNKPHVPTRDPVQRRVLVYRQGHRNQDQAPAAVLYPDGRIEDTNDPKLVQAIRAALADTNIEVTVGPTHFMLGSPGDYATDTAEWALVVSFALEGQGLVSIPLGWDFGWDYPTDQGNE